MRVVTLVLLAGCGRRLSAAPPPSAAFPVSIPASRTVRPTSSLGICEFRIGDIVRRGGGDFRVPPRGGSVAGFFGGARASGFIQMRTNLDGIVTIKSSITGQPEKSDVCRIP